MPAPHDLTAVPGADARRSPFRPVGRLIAVGTREELRRQSGAEGPLEQTFLALTAQEANQREAEAQVSEARP